jgi:hypothetical protein
MRVNHKRVMRIMAEDNLLAVQPKCFVITTNSAMKQQRVGRGASTEITDHDYVTGLAAASER